MKNILWSFVFVLCASGICSAQSVLYFPQFADGRTDTNSNIAWGTFIGVTNPAAVGTPAASVTITLKKDDGTPINLTLLDPTSGAPVGSTFQLGGGQTKVLVSPSNGVPLVPLNVGFATVTSNLPVTAGLIFIEYGPPTGNPISEAGVLAATPLTRQGIVAVRYAGVPGSLNTEPAVAIANPGAGTATIAFQLLDSSGTAVDSPVTRTLAANNHTAFFVSQLFPNIPSIFFGTMRITSDNPIVGTALTFSGNLFATIPVFPLQ